MPESLAKALWWVRSDGEINPYLLGEECGTIIQMIGCYLPALGFYHTGHLKKNILFSSFTEKDGFILYVLSLSRFPNHEKVIIIDEIIQKLSIVYVLTYVQNYFHNEDYR